MTPAAAPPSAPTTLRTRTAATVTLIVAVMGFFIVTIDAVVVNVAPDRPG